MTYTIITHPIWPDLLPYLRHSSRGGAKSRRIDVVPPSSLAKLRAFLAVQIRCCHCGVAMHPVRQRQGDTFTSPYFNVSCNIRPGCCRSGDASEEEKRVIAAIKGYTPPPLPTLPTLFDNEVNE